MGEHPWWSCYYPEMKRTDAGYVEVRYVANVLGDTSQAPPDADIPRRLDDGLPPAQPGNDGRSCAVQRCGPEGKVWCGEATNTAAAPTSGTWSGIHLAGGIATPAYGDPGMWLTQPDGSAFAVGVSDAVMFTAKTLTAAKDATFGFDFKICVVHWVRTKKHCFTGNTLCCRYRNSQ